MDFSNWVGAPKTSMNHHLALISKNKAEPSFSNISNHSTKNDNLSDLIDSRSYSSIRTKAVNHTVSKSQKNTELRKSYIEQYKTSKRKDACGVGVYAKLNSEPSHKSLEKSLTMLARMDHRGATGSDPLTSDGVGIMTQIPHILLKKSFKDLPDVGEYAVGQFFIPRAILETSGSALKELKETISLQCYKNGYDIIGWRDVPTNPSYLGKTSINNYPETIQLIIQKNQTTLAIENEFDKHRDLYSLTRSIESSFISKTHVPYIVSLSYETIVYKALCLSKNLSLFYPDLSNKEFHTKYAMVHQRFSTNTTPKWELAQPFRIISHNGEINTLRGNINSLISRERSLKSELPAHLLSQFPTSINKNLSDSGIFDGAISRDLKFTGDIFETLLGFSPDPLIENPSSKFDISLNEFYRYKSLSREPWDGPAFIGFCHQGFVGAKLDRNGLRPARYTLTVDGEFLVCSENGVMDIPDNKIVSKGRLSPGEIISVNTNASTVLKDHLIKKIVLDKKEYAKLTEEQITSLDTLTPSPFYSHINTHHINKLDMASCYGYTREDVQKIILPMAKTGKEPIASMGNDTSLAILSRKPRLLYDYFKQIFAQVTNPPIDAIREESKTSTNCLLGARHLEIQTRHHQILPSIELKTPVLTTDEYDSLLLSSKTAERIAFIETLFTKTSDLEKSLELIKEQAKFYIRNGCDLIILDDTGISREKHPIPMLLAVSSLHHELIKSGLRNRVSIISKTSEAREVHHLATLIGYGANAVYPELSYELAKTHIDSPIFPSKIEQNLQSAYTNGIRKIMSKIGISTVQSYHGSQIFEAIGLGQNLIDDHFCWTESKIDGINLEYIEKDILRKTAIGHKNPGLLASEGILSWRKTGEARQHTPSAVLNFKKSVELNSKEHFEKFCDEIDNKEHPVNLRDIYALNLKDSSSIDIDLVEPIENILKRFTSGAMSLGSISKEAHETIAVAMNRVGARSNSGEGGESKERNTPEPNGDLKRSAIRQIASGRFGVDLDYLVNADELQIKVAQGAKPGEGGQLPAHKVTLEIGNVRGSTPGVSLISPPPHHDIYSIEDLAQLIYDLKTVNPSAKVSVKLVSGTGVGTIAAGVAKAKADIILISGADGGTGASPVSSLYNAGLPWELGLSETHKTLLKNNLRSRVTLQVDGGLRTPKDFIIASILGAEEWGLGSVSLMAIGCVMMRQCHLNTCPVGIATQNKDLRKLFKGKPDHLITYLISLANAIRNTLAQLGIRSIDELIGKKDLLVKRTDFKDEHINEKLASLNTDSIFNQSIELNLDLPNKVSQNHAIEDRFDYKTLIPVFEKNLDLKKPINLTLTNLDRCVGTGLSAFIKSNSNLRNSTEPTAINFKGIAGQSFMAFGSEKITAHLKGEANDYVGKGLSGATVSIEPINKSIDEQVLIGNTALYGATSGSLFVSGSAGERFAVRNSGAIAVVEGVGEHALEYMTGGTVLILGTFGKNIGAGMSGGRSYIFDPLDELEHHINPELRLSIKSISKTELNLVYRLISKHISLTNSEKAKSILNNWSFLSKCFKSIKPAEYQKALKNLGKSHSVDLESFFTKQKPLNIDIRKSFTQDQYDIGFIGV